MSGYGVTATNAGGAFSQCGVKASTTYQMKLARVELVAGVAGTYTVSMYAGISFSGGTSVTPFALRQGAAATTATFKQGATVSGTQSVLTSKAIAASGADTYTPAFDLILNPGSGIWVSGVNFVSVSIYFEDLHLARSF